MELTDRMLRPPPVDTDVLWGALLTYRALGVRTDQAPDLDAPAKMLEIWHSGNPCYAALEAEVKVGPWWAWTRDAALRALRACIEGLPECNPYADR